MISPESADEEVNGDLVPRLALACSEVVAVSKKGRWKTVFASSLHFFRWRFQIHIASNKIIIEKTWWPPISGRSCVCLCHLNSFSERSSTPPEI